MPIWFPYLIISFKKKYFPSFNEFSKLLILIEIFKILCFIISEEKCKLVDLLIEIFSTTSIRIKSIYFFPFVITNKMKTRLSQYLF